MKIPVCCFFLFLMLVLIEGTQYLIETKPHKNGNACGDPDCGLNCSQEEICQETNAPCGIVPPCCNQHWCLKANETICTDGCNLGIVCSTTEKCELKPVICKKAPCCIVPEC